MSENFKRWQVAQTGQIDKSNGKKSTKAIRLINMMCPMGKVFFKRIWNEKKRKLYHCSYGYTKNRRREQALLVQKAVGWKLKGKLL